MLKINPKIFRRLIAGSACGLFAACLALPIFAESPGQTPASIARRIHERRGEWIGLKADLNLDFITAKGQKITCRGELAYQRLDEKILLKGFNEKNELLFAFKTSDRNFELFLPMIGENYQGSIFALEDSPEIQSHLRALDLYRALKPGAVPVERARLSEEKKGNFLIQIQRTKNGPLLSRRLETSSKGDVLREEFYSPEGTVAAEIFRNDFREIKNKNAPKAVFPYRIEIVSASKKTVLSFSRLELFSEMAESEFAVPLPPDTKQINLEN